MGTLLSIYVSLIITFVIIVLLSVIFKRVRICAVNLMNTCISYLKCMTNSFFICIIHHIMSNKAPNRPFNGTLVFNQVNLLDTS